MSDDRELLELAARAAGIELKRWNATYAGYETAQGLWNALLNDGDALRLAVKLGLDINVYPASGEVGAVKHHQSAKYSRYFESVVNNDWDWATATRRAIVRAAAEIGRQITD